VPLGGVLAQQGKVPLWLVFVLGSAGSIVGDSIGYEVGRRYGDRLLRRLPRWLVKPEHLERGKDLLRRRGGVAVFGSFHRGVASYDSRAGGHEPAPLSQLCRVQRRWRDHVDYRDGTVGYIGAYLGVRWASDVLGGWTSAPDSSAWPSPLSMYAAAPTDPPAPF